MKRVVNMYTMFDMDMKLNALGVSFTGMVYIFLTMWKSSCDVQPMFLAAYCSMVAMGRMSVGY